MLPATWPLSAMATAWDSAPRSAVSTKEAAAARGADPARKTDATAKTTTPSRSLITPGPKPQSPALFDSRTCKPTRATKKSSAAGPTPRPRSVVRFCHQVAGALDESSSLGSTVAFHAKRKLGRQGRCRYRSSIVVLLQLQARDVGLRPRRSALGPRHPRA